MTPPKASEFFIFGLKGCSPTKREQAFLDDNAIGGIIHFRRNIESLEQIIAQNTKIIESHKHPPLICVDQEGGRVARLRGLATDVPAMAKLRTFLEKDEHLAYRLGAMQARELTALGFSLNFSPVCDIASDVDNEVIGDRAFSNQAHQVARFSSHYIRGLQEAGIAGCAKHFPGHGATSVDSHLALPVLDTDLDTLYSRELVPFKSAIEVNVATIMTAHIVTKSLDPYPATLSEKTLQQLLRRELNFQNVLISDDLDMKAVADHYSLAEIIEASMLASVDMFIIGDNFDKTLEAISTLDRLIKTDQRIFDCAVIAQKRIKKLKDRYIGKPKAPDLASALSIIRSAPHLDLIKNLTSSSIKPI